MTESLDLRSQIDRVWTSLCRCLTETVDRYNAERGQDRLHMHAGDVVGWIKVKGFDSERKMMHTLGFQLMMNTGGLSAWYQEDLTRWSIPVDSVTVNKTLLVRYEQKPLSIPDMVDRVFDRWLERTQLERK